MFKIDGDMWLVYMNQVVLCEPELYYTPQFLGVFSSKEDAEEAIKQLTSSGILYLGDVAAKYPVYPTKFERTEAENYVIYGTDYNGIKCGIVAYRVRKVVRDTDKGDNDFGSWPER